MNKRIERCFHVILLAMDRLEWSGRFYLTHSELLSIVCGSFILKHRSNHLDLSCSLFVRLFSIVLNSTKQQYATIMYVIQTDENLPYLHPQTYG